MLSRSCYLATKSSHSLLLCRPAVSAQTERLCRSYAISRFPRRAPGVGRIREKVTPRPRDKVHSSRQQSSSDQFGHEERGLPANSPLWEASQRPPASNPEEGLKRLLLDNDMLVITRQIEMLNIFIGFEQSNKYVITNELGDTLGYIAEEPRGILSTFSRQIFRTHRPFRAVVMDREGSPVLWLRRPFAWINSRMFVQRLKDYSAYTPEGEPILDTFAEVQQVWHLWRRKYDLFLRDSPRRILSVSSDHQFARVDEGLWAWHFTLRDGRGEEIASVNRAFRGFGREIFTDTGQYFVRFGPSPPLDAEEPAPPKPSVIRVLNLKERALVLAMSVNIDFDYFSRHSEGGHGFGLPFWWFEGE